MSLFGKRSSAEPSGPARSSGERLPVTVVSGFLGAGKTTLLEHLLTVADGPRIAVIVNDFSEIDIDAALLARGGGAVERVSERMVELPGGCICCTLREDLLSEVAQLAGRGEFDYLVIESSGISEPMAVAETFTFADESGAELSRVAQLDTMVTVIDGHAFRGDVASADAVSERGVGAEDDDDRGIAELIVDQVEFCDVAVINKCDLIDAEELAKVEALIATLNPRARILRAARGVVDLAEVLGTGRFDFEAAEQAQGWLAVARGEEAATHGETRHAHDDEGGVGHDHDHAHDLHGVSSFAFRARVPFHPERLWALANAPWPGVLRAKGFYWLATRHDQVGLWSQAGGVLSIDNAGDWVAALDPGEIAADPDLAEIVAEDWVEPYGDRRQELVFIGIDVDRVGIERALRKCLLTAEELALGPDGWAKQLSDPFP